MGHWLAAGGEASTDDDGYAYLFDRDTGEYIDKLQPPSPRPHPNDRFGWSSVAVRDDKVLITASPDPALAGDLNDDGFVGSADLDIVRANWGATVEPGDLSAGDADGDGQVNSADLDVIRANWGAMWDPSSGCGYLFEVADAKLLQTFPQPQTAAYEFFGAAATVVGDEIVLAAPCASLAADESGAVYLFEAGIQTVRTDEDGLYEFTGLEDGTYRVRQRNTTNYATIQTLPGPDATIPAYQVEIDGSAIRASKDFGLSYAPKVVEGQEFVYEISSGTPQEAVNSGNPCEWSPPEGAYIGTVTGNIHPSKVDSGAHLQDWEIVSYNPRNAFRIDDSGRLFVNDSASLLFEKSCTWIIEVSVSDGTRRSLPQAVAVTVRDKAYSPEPIFVSGQVLYPDGGGLRPQRGPRR